MGGHKTFSENGVAVYGSTVAVATSYTNDVAVYSDTGTKSGSLSVTSIAGIAIYGDVIAAHDSTSVYSFEKISGGWTQTSSLTPSNSITNVAMYSSFIAIGSTSMCLYIFVSCFAAVLVFIYYWSCVSQILPRYMIILLNLFRLIK